MRSSAGFSGKVAVLIVADRATSHGTADIQRKRRADSEKEAETEDQEDQDTTLQLARRATTARKWGTSQENARKQAAVAHRGLGNNRARAKEEPGHLEEAKDSEEVEKAKAASHLIGDHVEDN